MADESTPYPSRDVLTAAHRRLWALQLTDRGSGSRHWRQAEDELLPYILGTADALASIRPELRTFRGWPRRLNRAVTTAARFLDSLIDAWGWRWLVDLPEAERAAAVADRRAAFNDPIDLEMMLSALAVESAWQGMEGYREWEDWHAMGNPSIDDWAEKGRAAGLANYTVTPEEGKERFKAAARKRVNTPTLGTCYPSFEAIGESHLSGLRHEFIVALGVMKADLGLDGNVRPWRPGEGEAEPEAAPTEPAVVPLASGAPTAMKSAAGRNESRRRDRGKTAQCAGLYLALIEKGDGTPPTPTMIANKAKCSVATASRAIASLRTTHQEVERRSRRP